MNISEVKAALTTVLSLANAQIEDVESGLADGTYTEQENSDLPEKKYQLGLVETFLQTLNSGADSISLLVSAAREDLAGQIPLSAEEALELQDKKVKLEGQIRLAQCSTEIVMNMVERYEAAVLDDTPIDGGDAVEDLVRWVLDAQEVIKADLPQTPMVVYQGWVKIGDSRIDVSFETPAGATVAEKDAAMMQQLSMEAEVDYVCIC